MSSPPIPQAAPAPAAISLLGSRLAVMSVACAMFMQSIDSTALSTALPTIARAFAVDPIQLKLALTAYIMALAVFVPASAWVADRFGARRIFVAAVGVFLLGSVLCGLSSSLTELVAARILQGVGGAMMAPVGRIIVVASHPRDQLVTAMAWLTTPAMVGPILGPALSGLILSVADWPWIFYINVPFGVLGIAAVLRFVPKKDQPHPGQFDTWGFALAATSICAAMIGAESVGVKLLPLWGQAVTWLICLATGWAYVRHAKRRERPVLDLSLLKVHTLLVNQTGGTLVRMSIGAMPFLLPLLLQTGLGWSPLQAGLLTMSTAVGALSARFGARAFLRKFGFRVNMIATAIACGIAFAATGWFRADTPVVVMVAVLAIGGLLRANHLMTASALAFADIPDKAVSQASSLTSVVMQMAQALGITVAGFTLHLSQVITAPHGVRPLAPENFILPFGVTGLCAVAAAWLYWPLSPEAGSNLHSRKGGAR